jgi:hypothetical protein
MADTGENRAIVDAQTRKKQRRFGRQKGWFLRSVQQQKQALLHSAVAGRVLNDVGKQAKSGILTPKLRRRKLSQTPATSDEARRVRRVGCEPGLDPREL